MIAIPSRIRASFVRPEWVINWWYCLDVRMYLSDGLGGDGPYCWAFPSPGKIEVELSCVFGEALQSGLSCSRGLGMVCLLLGEV